MTVLDRQITLNVRIKKADEEFSISTALCEKFRKDGNEYHYDQARELLTFWSARRRWLIQRLIKVQLKEFIR